MKKTFNPLTRSRNWSLVCYDDPSTSLSPLLSQSQNYVYIFHNSPLEKTPHYHVLLFLKHAKTASAILSYNTSEQNCMCEPVIDRVRCFRYLRHLDNPDKVQYPAEALVSDNIAYWNKLDSNSDYSPSGENMLSLLEDINAHKPLRDLIGIYGRDFVIHYDIYLSMAYRLKVHDEQSRITPAETPIEVSDDDPF